MPAPAATWPAFPGWRAARRSAPLRGSRRRAGGGAGARDGETRGEDLEPLERSLDERDLRAIASEVAATQRRLRALGVGIGVVAEAAHVWRPAGWAAGGR